MEKQEAGKVSVSIVDFSNSGKSLRARDVNDPRCMYNIRIQDAEACQVRLLDGSTVTGLSIGRYDIHGYVDPVKTPDGKSEILMLNPLAAREVKAVEVDWDQLPSIKVEGNRREQTIGAGNATENATTPPADFVPNVEAPEEAPVI